MAKKIRIYYRAAGHVPLWKVMEEGGFLKKQGLEVDLGSMEGKRQRAMEGLRAGDLDVISGSHHNLYAYRALHGDPFVHIAQTNNLWKENWLVARDGINGVKDLKGKRIAMDDFDGHTGLNVWLYLKLNGLQEGRDVELLDGDKKGLDRVRKVMAGEYDATFVRAVDQLRARAIGARVIDLPESMAMIEGVTLTTTTTYVNSHEDEVRGLLKALVDAIHFFRTRRRDTLDIIDRTCKDLLKFQCDEEQAMYYENQVKSLEPKPYPTLDAVRNVFALAVKRNPEIASFNPLAMWDLHHLREIDDSGYIDRLYAD
ncbi:MAG TPA: ABC transporter substrate-binding protein [Candidatus Binatia bacterium]|jgi:ABC-type nitrate/sulfonate/bicarbonate transport system substrate-binding protein